MLPRYQHIWRQVEAGDAAQLAAFTCGDAEVEQMVQGLLLPCHDAMYNGVGPWRCFALHRTGAGDLVAVAAIEQRHVQPPMFQHEATYIPLVAVHTSYQGLGYSRVLMARVLDEARQQRGDIVWAEVAIGNGKAKRLFGHHEFEPCPIRPQLDPSSTHAMWLRWK